MYARAGMHSPQTAASRHADPSASASPSPTPATRHAFQTDLLEPRSTPRPRSRTRPGGLTSPSEGYAGSPSPIHHGSSYRSFDKSTLLPTASILKHTAAGYPSRNVGTLEARKAIARDGTGSHTARVTSPRAGRSQALQDEMLAATDRRLRHGARASPARAATTGGYGMSDTLGGGYQGPSPLALALRAQWALIKQQQQQSSGGNAPGLSPSLRAATEKDLLRALGSLPAQDPGVVAKEAEEIVPYLLAFAVAPVPSSRTQAVALAALHGILMELPKAWGREAAAVFVKTLFVGDNEALAAFDMALHRVLEDKANDAEDWATVTTGATRRGAARMEQRARGNSQAAASSPSAEAQLRLAITDSILDILYDAVVLSPATASLAMAQGTLLRDLIEYLPEATPTQAPTIAGILQAIVDAPEPSAPSATATVTPAGVRQRNRDVVTAERAAVLAAYNAHHVVLNCIRASVRATFNGRGDLAADATVTNLCILLRLAIRLSTAPSAFDLVVQDDAFSVLLAQLLTTPWGDVVELTCLWTAALLAHFPLKEGPIMARNLLAKGEAVQVLTRLLGWRDPQTFSYATSAAICWRWLFLSSGGSGGSAHGAPAAEVAVAEPGIFLSFIHAFLTNPMPEPRQAGREEAPAARQARRDRALFTCELLVGVAAAFAAGTEYTRAAMHLLLLERLTADIFDFLRTSVRDTLLDVSDTYFDKFPPLALEEGTELCEVVAAASVELRQQLTGARTSARLGEAGVASSAADSHSRASSTASSAPEHAQTQRSYQSQYMRNRARSSTGSARSMSANSGLSDEDSQGRRSHTSSRGRVEGLREADDVTQPGSGAVVISTRRQWRVVVQCSWDLLLSGAPLPAEGGGGVSRLATPFAATPSRQSLLKAPQLSRTTQNSSVSALRRQAAPGAAEASPHATTSLTMARLLLLQQQQQQRPLPRYQQREVVQRAATLADSGSFYQQSIRTVLRLAHQYVKAGVVGVAQLPLTGMAMGEKDGGNMPGVNALREEQDEDACLLAFEQSAFGLVVSERPEYAPQAAVALSASAERRRRRQSQERRRSLSQGSQASANSLSPRRGNTSRRSGSPSTQRAPAPKKNPRYAPERQQNPWAPPAKVRSARRWHVRDLQRSDLLLFAISYEDLVPDLADTIDAVEAHVAHLRSQLQTCPTREITRRLVLNDLYMNVYPKIHMFLRYIQHQVARSRVVLQLLSDMQDGSDLCIHSGNVTEVYDAVGHCVGEG